MLDFQRIELRSGLRVLVAEDDRLPLVSISAVILAGADQNPLTKPGLASLAVALLDEGAGPYTHLEIAGLVEQTGGQLNTFSNREISGINLLLGKPDFEQGVELLMAMLSEPHFSEDRFRLEQRSTLNELSSILDDPQFVANTLFDHVLYQGTSLEFPAIGTPESIGNLTPEDLRSFHAQTYAPQNAVLVIVGSVSAQRVVDSVERQFLTWTNDGFRRELVSGLKRQTRPRSQSQYLDRKQVQILVGHLGVERKHPDYDAMEVLDVILGSGPGFTSRIPRRLRDEQALSYHAYATVLTSAGLYPGKVLVSVSTSSENRKVVQKMIHRELESVVREGVTSSEVKMAQDFLVGSFVFNLETNLQKSGMLLSMELFGLGKDFPARYTQRIRAITRQQVCEIAQEQLETLNYTTVLVGPVRSGDRPFEAIG